MATTSKQRAAKLAVVAAVAIGATLAYGQTRKDFRFTLRTRGNVSITNPYGLVSLKPAVGNQVIVSVILHSDKVEVYHDQSGNRVELRSQLLPGADQDSGIVEYQVQIPATTTVLLHATTGPLQAERLRGDVLVESVSAPVDIHDISEVHVHVKTLNGPVTLTNVRNGHVEITSVSGDVTLNSVTGPLVQVNSSSGKIHYEGDFGAGGEYSLSSHSGNIDAAAPAEAPISLDARSVNGTVDSEFAMDVKHPAPQGGGNSFLSKAWSLVKLRSFSGKIHVKKMH
jgi:Toastrack DUF4097